MTFYQAKRGIEAMGYSIIAQTCYGKFVAYGARDLNPIDRKRLIKGPADTPERAMNALNLLVTERELDKGTIAWQ